MQTWPILYENDQKRKEKELPNPAENPSGGQGLTMGMETLASREYVPPSALPNTAWAGFPRQKQLHGNSHHVPLL